MTIVAYDPGEMTGFATFETDDSQRVARLCRSGEIYGFSPQIADQIQWAKVIVFERAVILSPAFDPIPFEVIGMIKYLAGKYLRFLVEQSPEIPKSISRWETYDLSPFRSHARDAVCHGIAYLTSAGYTVVLT